MNGVPAPRRRVMLLFGGQSAEHDVSRVTAVAVARALDPAKYDVIPVGITTEGRWLLAGEAQKMLASGRDALPAAFAVEGDLMPVPSASRAASAPLEADVVIPLLHGPYGEDGTVQGVLELAGLPYVGAGVLGSAVAMDKIAMKQMFVGAGLETARALTLRDGHDIDDFVRARRDRARVPVLREAREHGFVGRCEQGARPPRSCATRSSTRSRSTSGCSPRRW